MENSKLSLVNWAKIKAQKLNKKAKVFKFLDNFLVIFIFVLNVSIILLAGIALNLLIKKYEQTKNTDNAIPISAFISCFFTIFFIILSFFLGIFIKIYSSSMKAQYYQKAINQMKIWIAQYENKKEDFKSNNRDKVFQDKINQLNEQISKIKINNLKLKKAFLRQATGGKR